MRRFFLGLAIIAALGAIPCKARANDRQIAQKIVEGLQEYKEKGELKGINIDLQVDEGAVYLKGQVTSTEQEELALDVARHIDGVTKVYNELEIVESKPATTAKVKDESRLRPASIIAKTKRAAEPSRISADFDSNTDAGAQIETPDSRELAEQIYARLKDEKDNGRLKGFSLDLEVEDGVAWLKGTVATPEQLSRVLETVRRVPGVNQVVNGITVTSAAKSPANLAQQVIEKLQAMKNSGELKDFRLDVEVEEGIVWLTGNVASEEQRDMVLETARYIPGVVKVVNDISIGNSATTVKRSSQVRTVSEVQIRRVPTPPADESEGYRSSAPRPIPSFDGPIGSSVARSVGASRSNRSRPEYTPQPSVPAPALNQSADIDQGARQTVQYVWVPGSQGASAGQGMASGKSQAPLAFAPARAANYTEIDGAVSTGAPLAMNPSIPGAGIAAARFDHPQMPNYAWPSYASYPNYGAVTYPKQYSAMAWPYIGPFYPYPQVPLGWRKVTLEWDDGWWQLDFKSRH